MNFPRSSTTCHAAVLAIAVTLIGCTLPHYQTKEGKLLPPQSLNFTATQPPLELLLHTVIVHSGPGAWKEETWWDEYVVSVTNHSDTPLRIETVSLVDFESQASSPGDDPWKLERAGKQWWQSNTARNTGYALALGVGTFATAGAAFWGGAAATGTFAGAATAASIIVFAALPVAIVSGVVINNNQKHRIEAEFHRRRLVLPTTMAPGGTAKGSLFFRISPGPQRLVFAFHADGQPHELSLDLKQLAALHFKKRIYSNSPAPTPTPPKPTPDSTPPAPEK